MRALSVKNKLGFIDGSCVKPDASSNQFHQWQRCDDMVTSWILNSLTKEIADSVEYFSDSVELWKELEDRYDQTNGAKLYQIQKEIDDHTGKFGYHSLLHQNEKALGRIEYLKCKESVFLCL